MSEAEGRSFRQSPRSWSKSDTRRALGLAAELAGFALMFVAGSAVYKVLGGFLVVGGLLLWDLPGVGRIIAQEKARDSRRNSCLGGRESDQVVEQPEAADNTQGTSR